MKIWRSITCSLLVCAMLLGLTACGQKDPGPQQDDSAAIDISGLTEEQIAEYKAMPLVVYTNSGAGGRADWWTKRRKRPVSPTSPS